MKTLNAERKNETLCRITGNKSQNLLNLFSYAMDAWYWNNSLPEGSRVFTGCWERSLERGYEVVTVGVSRSGGGETCLWGQVQAFPIL